jgi:hypothetical protein
VNQRNSDGRYMEKTAHDKRYCTTQREKPGACVIFFLLPHTFEPLTFPDLLIPQAPRNLGLEILANQNSNQELNCRTNVNDDKGPGSDEV